MENNNRAKNIKTLKVFGYIVLISFVLIIIVALNSDNKSEQNLETKAKIEANVISDETRKRMRDATKELYNQLMTFKDDKKFHEVGFGTCCKYNKWLVTVDKVSEKWNSITESASIKEKMDDRNLNLSTSISYLRMIATNYMRNKGVNDNFTNEQLPNIKKTLQIK